MQESEQQKPAETPRDRLQALYPGVRQSVLSRYLRVSRMVLAKLDQHSPTLERLTPAVRIERLSLSWLATGEGSPFIVYTARDDDAAHERVDTLLADQPDMKVVVAISGVSYALILHAPAENVADGETYHWQQVEVISGVLGKRTADRVAWGSTYLMMDRRDFDRLTSGWMGNAELFGWEAQPCGLIEHARPGAPRPLDQVREPGADYGDAMRQQALDAEALRLLHKLSPAEQDLILRQLRGLAKTPPDER